MTQTTITGFPRIGENRELKFATEKYFRGESTIEKLTAVGKALRQKHWHLIKEAGITDIPSNDFSFYDTTLDTACLFNLVPHTVRKLGLAPLDEYFALARGYQGVKGDIKARPMKKWFNTNYHYLVPKIERSTTIKVNGQKIFDEFLEAKELGIITRPVLLGPFTLLQLAEIEEGVDQAVVIAELVKAYQEVMSQLATLGAKRIQLDEPSLVRDLTKTEVSQFTAIYEVLLTEKPLEVCIQTYFGDVRDAYEALITLPVEAIGLDFVEGRETAKLVQTGFPADKELIIGIVNGKNIWRNDYQQSLACIQAIPVKHKVISTSCSLLHVPFTTEHEIFPATLTQHFAFAKEKLSEIIEIATILDDPTATALTENQQLFNQTRIQENQALKTKIAQLTAADFERKPAFKERQVIQRAEFQFPELPTTTIGSFPQTTEVKQKRANFKKGAITKEEYDEFVKQQINEWLAWQEEIGLDVLVHGEFERNDMVEYFGQNLAGYLFSQNGWVQSYGTRGVKPPIIWGDIQREQPITVEWSSYAQSQTKKVVKGMLTGPVTILNWSFPREDISLREATLQLALAIQEEVLDLEKNGIRVIQIDEAALREKLPLRQSDWYSEYLDWAIPAFRLVHSKVQAQTQIHTHMCYSEFTDIIEAIDHLDADVISFEASRSNLEILDELVRRQFQTEVGPGVYDIHSPRVPSVTEISETIAMILSKVPRENVWINPDCGLKTRGIPETKASLINLVTAAKSFRKE